MRVITELNLLYVSIDDKPNAWGEHITVVGKEVSDG